jgi:hypothetical protein
MLNEKPGKKIIAGLALIFAILVVAPSFALAEDTAQLVYSRCTKCHAASRWESRKETQEGWARIVNRMSMYGAQLSDEEGMLIIGYLTAMSSGNFNTGGTNFRYAPVKKSVTNTGARKASLSDLGDVLMQQSALQSDQQLASVASSTSTASAAQAASKLKEQAHTGVELVWYLLAGGVLIGSGLALRNKDKRLGV